MYLYINSYLPDMLCGTHIISHPFFSCIILEYKNIYDTESLTVNGANVFQGMRKARPFLSEDK